MVARFIDFHTLENLLELPKEEEQMIIKRSTCIKQFFTNIKRL